MATVTGVVEGVSTKFGKYSILVDGTWYGTKEEWATVKPNKGDAVSFDNGGAKFFKNCTITGGGSAPAASASASGSKSYSKGSFPVDPEDGSRAILRQNALTNARNLFGELKEGQDMEAAVATIIEMAREFEAFTSGDTERYAAEAKVKDAFLAE